MRPIDADYITGISVHVTGNSDYDRGYTEGVVRVLKAIENAPTIDAIPVEWFEKHIKDNPNSLWACSCKYLVWAWQREQEEKQCRGTLI